MHCRKLHTHFESHTPSNEFATIFLYSHQFKLLTFYSVSLSLSRCARDWLNVVILAWLQFDEWFFSIGYWNAFLLCSFRFALIFNNGFSFRIRWKCVKIANECVKIIYQCSSVFSTFIWNNQHWNACVRFENRSTTAHTWTQPCQEKWFTRSAGGGWGGLRMMWRCSSLMK